MRNRVTLEAQKNKTIMNISELKLINGIKYFIKNTRNVGRTKLFKLLYFWDFIHFKRFGTSVSGLDYFTYPFGPVPKKLYDEISSGNLPEPFQEHFKIVETKDEEDDFKQFTFHLKNKEIDLDWLSPNELSVLKEVALIFKYSTAKEMSEITHLKNTPWDKTKEEGMFRKIDYFLALDEDTVIDIDTIKERFRLQQELLSDGRI